MGLRLLPGEYSMTKLHKVLILGSGALKIGQAGEFDYSGSQALKALKEEGVQTILLNPNIATIQTSQILADRIYFLPVTPYFAEKIIEREKPDGILLSFGGQTALNCGIALHESGVLARHNVQILGTPISAIILTEDRQKFAEHLHAIDIPTPRSQSATTLQEAMAIGTSIGFPVMVRAGFALGGQGSGIASNAQELEQIVEHALSFAPQVLIEQYLHHYKEVEYEVVRDSRDNCITVCNMENMDPLGIHTGESIVVAPSQTLTNTEYHMLRAASIAIVRSLGIVGECNVQYALNPKTSEYYVIEVNARLSRSSALASKVTGYPLAYVAAKLALGYSLVEIPNKVTGITKACFEPSLDYLAVKIPRWDLAKFKGVDETIGTGMKSVGEVMGIGRTFEEAYQKAIRMLEQSFNGAVPPEHLWSIQEELEAYLSTPTPKRSFALARAIKAGYALEDLYTLTGIDPWFLQRIKNIVDTESRLNENTSLSAHELRNLKQLGLSDKRIAELIGKTELEIRQLRKQLGVLPSVFQIDTLAAEFPSTTNYLYVTYNGQHNDVEPTGEDGVIVLGSGPYRIGSSVEFDWTSVSTVEALKKYQKQAIIINSNPETVSTDYDVSDRLYFEELTFERIADIYDFESPHGLIVSVGGQTPNNRAQALHAYGCNLLGTRARDIDRAENRSTFSHLLDTLSIRQPEWNSFSTVEELASFAERVSYPVLVRPSYVLSGSAMKVCDTLEELERYARQAAAVSPRYPVTVSKFFEFAREVEFDAVAQHGQVKAYVISEHIENAGVHSGDATIVLPPQSIPAAIQEQITEIGYKIARALHITGPFNIQFLVKDGQVYVIETNLRASRTFPFISKVTGINFMELFVDTLFTPDIPEVAMPPIPFTAIKAPQFSFSRLTNADPVLSVEMSSTGEIACFGEDAEEAYLKARLAAGEKIPSKGIFLSLCGEEKHTALEESLPHLKKLGVPLYATDETWQFLQEHGIDATPVYHPCEDREPDVRDLFPDHQIDLAVVIVAGRLQKDFDEYYQMRRLAIDYNIQLITKIKQLRLFLRALVSKNLDTLPIKAWDEYRIVSEREDVSDLTEEESLLSTRV
jgi:carbamoyl-phosphate synthase large subunit